MGAELSSSTRRCSTGAGRFWHQARVADHTGILWRREKLQESTRLILVRTGRHDGGREGRDVLHLLRQVAHNVDSLDGKQLAALLATEVGFMLGDDFTHRGGRDLAALRSDLVGDPQL